MNNLPKVTIITVTYNLVKANLSDYFREMVESVKNQTYQNIEHLVVDGASNDGTVDLLEECAQKGCIKYISEPDKGIYEAMNKGIAKAEGKYICFLNSDDYFNNIKAVELSVNALEKENADYSYAKTIFINRNGKVYDNIMQANPDMANLFLTMPFCHQAMFTKRDVLFENPFNTDRKSAADYETFIRMVLKGYKGIFVDETIVTFRLGGMSNNLENRKTVFNEHVDIYYDIFKEFLPSITTVDCKKIVEKQALPDKLWRILTDKVGFAVKKDISTNKTFYLFGFIPLFKIKTFTYVPEIRYYLFNKILIWKTIIYRYNRRCSLFGKFDLFNVVGRFGDESYYKRYYNNDTFY